MVTNLMRTRQAHNLTSRQVADQAGLPLRVEYTAEIGGPVDEEDASKIASALSILTGQCYTYETLGLILKKKEQP